MFLKDNSSSTTIQVLKENKEGSRWVQLKTSISIQMQKKSCQDLRKNFKKYWEIW